jgi:hypothetical protein
MGEDIHPQPLAGKVDGNILKEKQMRHFAMRSLLSGMMLACIGTLAHAQLQTTRTDLNPTTSNFVRDGVISANEYGSGNAYVYTGGGTGFGGPVGTGSLYMDFDSANLNIGFQFGTGPNNDAQLNDIAVIYFDTRAGGFGDAEMNDTADGGRTAVSNLARDSNDAFPFQADYAVAIGNFGIVQFELAAGGNNSLVFKAFDAGNGNAYQTNSVSGARETSILKSDAGITGAFDFFVAYTSGDGFLSDEAIPAQPFSGSGNLGYGTIGGTNSWTNFNRFQPVPSPASWSIFALGSLPLISVLRRRRK